MAGYIATTKTIEWSTPPEVYRALCRHFLGVETCDVDLACTPENQRAPIGLYAPDDVLAAYDLPKGKARNAAIRTAQNRVLDARLIDILTGPGPRNYWLNPPYGSELPMWIKFAHDIVYGYPTRAMTVSVPSFAPHRSNRTEVYPWQNRVIVLIPARTDTRWFHQYCAPEEILFLKGRLRFGGARASAPFPSAAILFGGVPALRQFGELIQIGNETIVDVQTPRA